jgi:diaminopimelate decarboxylase
VGVIRRWSGLAGDILALLNTGSYGATTATFHRHRPHAAEIVL